MGKLADAIRDRRKGGPRRLGFGVHSEERQPSMLVGAIGAVDTADFCVAVDEQEADALETADVALWGVRVETLDAASVAAAKSRGAAFVAFTVEGAMADGMLDDDIDYVVRDTDPNIDEAVARAIGSLRPAVADVPLEFPLSLSAVLQLRRLAMLTSTPLGTICPAQISDGDLQALRDSGVVSIVLEGDASAADVTAIKQRIADLPERKQRRDEDARPLIPTVSPSAASED